MTKAKGPSAWKTLIPVAAALPLLAVIQWGSWSAATGWVSPAVYHGRIVLAAAVLPEEIGPWKGTEIPLPPGAVAMLKPNAADAKSFHNARTGENAVVLFVQCHDARDLLGHYPPICYPANGWQASGQRQVELKIGDKVIATMEYDFLRTDDLLGTSTLQAYDLLIIPGGDLSTDMERVNKRGSDHRRKNYGAGQVEVVFNGARGADDRDAACQALLEAYWPAIQKVQTGVRP